VRLAKRNRKENAGKNECKKFLHVRWLRLRKQLQTEGAFIEFNNLRHFAFTPNGIAY
jgi:hypothetical protein